MNRRFCAAIAAIFVSASLSHPAAAQWETLQARMALVTDEALNPGAPTGPEVVAGVDCDITAGEAAKFDKLLTLSAAEEDAARKLHGPWGLPAAIKAMPDERFLVHREYVVNYNRNLKIPVYATYVLTSKDVRPAKSEKCFREDLRLEPEARSVLEDYLEPIFDRGHLVPRADMNRSRAVMINTFVLSNMMPQHDQFNQGIWQTLESAVRAWTLDKGSVVIFSGAIFDANTDGVRDDPAEVGRVKPKNRVAIPTHFYKIVLHERPSGFIDAIAILLPHTDNEVPKSLKPEQKLAYLEENIVSIADIEALTGYSFFPDMPPIKQKAVKRSVASGLWQ
jgi:endonuclease G